MRIYQMTATFGKLEHETLRLEPGLNILHAPNEWGKSTWCAFLTAMLYGLDTRAKSTKAALADKERYAPWSGSPMAGRIDLSWNGRNITIERRTKGRIPMGEFQAYETATGLPVAELTAANCGQMLLGVEQSVFRRAGFIRLSDLPVTQDDTLRRRLNALVTTGDESGDGERLARDLRDLKNRVRYNRTGLIPQAEQEREGLARKIEEWDSLEVQSKKLKSRLGEVKEWLRQLENHQQALVFADAEADAGRVAEARDVRDQAVAQLEMLENACASLPNQEEAERKIRELKEFQEQWSSVQMEVQLLPGGPEPPEAPEPFRGISTEEAGEMVAEDREIWRKLRKFRGWPIVFLAGICWAGAAVLVALGWYWLGAGAFTVGGVLLAVGFGMRKQQCRKRSVLEEKYGSADPQQWAAELEDYTEALERYARSQQEFRTARGNVDARLAALQRKRESLCGGQTPERVLAAWQQAMARWEDYHNARREAQRAEKHFQTLQAMAKPARRPAMADELVYSETETARLISDAVQEQQRLQNRLGQYQGRMEALGDREALQKELDRIQDRIQELEDVYAAVTIAQDTLQEAKLELQRRFAPRISRRAQELLAEMTAGRYDRLTLGEDFSLRAGTGEEDTLHEALWRSDGTVDQLYLALRLAVSEELSPQAPLVLDDALARFDDDRMKAALEILKKEAETKQVILFSCQSREKDAVG